MNDSEWLKALAILNRPFQQQQQEQEQEQGVETMTSKVALVIKANGKPNKARLILDMVKAHPKAGDKELSALIKEQFNLEVGVGHIAATKSKSRATPAPVAVNAPKEAAAVVADVLKAKTTARTVPSNLGQLIAARQLLQKCNTVEEALVAIEWAQGLAAAAV